MPRRVTCGIVSTTTKFGQRLLVDFGNGARTTYAYAYDDKTRRITSVKASLPNGYTFHDLAFSYDKVGNLTELKSKTIRPGDFPGPGLGNAIGGPWTKDYAYDQLYRMTTSAGQHQTNPNEVSTYSYDQTYDTIHNITRKNQVHQFKNSTQPDTTYDYTPSPIRVRDRHARTARWPSAPTTSSTMPTATDPPDPGRHLRHRALRLR